MARKSKASSGALHDQARAAQALPKSIEAFLDQQHNQDMLRFITCGSVDDGKSTLIGPALTHETSANPDDIF
ncbi:hypothetical protein [Propionivibrio sp.]|uniref:hypothetical protein n=1 Tax=Propionivibrio sp. TaxID=2212460 RepID=UPI003BF16DB4